MTQYDDAGRVDWTQTLGRTLAEAGVKTTNLYDAFGRQTGTSQTVTLPTGGTQAITTSQTLYPDGTTETATDPLGPLPTGLRPNLGRLRPLPGPTGGERHEKRGRVGGEVGA